MSVVPTQQETDDVTGTLEGVVTEGPTKFIVQVRPDGSTSQFPRKLRTNDPALAQELAGYIGHRLYFQCRVSRYPLQGETEANMTGQSRWINGWTWPGATQDGMTPVGAVVQQVMPTPPAPTMVAPVQAVPQQPMPVAAPTAAPPPAPAVPVAPMPQAPPTDVTWGEKELRIMREAGDKVAVHVLVSLLAREVQTSEYLTDPAKLHLFLDSFSRRRQRFYETGDSTNTDDIPF